MLLPSRVILEHETTLARALVGSISRHSNCHEVVARIFIWLMHDKEGLCGTRIAPTQGASLLIRRKTNNRAGKRELFRGGRLDVADLVLELLFVLRVLLLRAWIHNV